MIIINRGLDTERQVAGDKYVFHKNGFIVVFKGGQKVFSISNDAVITIEKE